MMKKYGALFVLSALLLAGCGAEYTAGQTAAEIAEQPAAEINAAETGVTDPAGRTGYIDSNGIFIPDPSNSGRPDDFADEETVTEAYPADDTAPAADYGQKSAEQYQNQNENRQMRADAFCRALQINPLPEKLGGCTLQIDPDARFDPDKYTGYDEGYYTSPMSMKAVIGSCASISNRRTALHWNVSLHFMQRQRRYRRRRSSSPAMH